MLRSLNMVHFHFTLSMWAYQLQVEFLFLTVLPLEDFQGPLEFHGHGSWYVCKATLMLIPPPPPPNQRLPHLLHHYVEIRLPSRKSFLFLHANYWR
jgi:hypothetical protein